MAALDHPLLVPTCIGCGARFRAGSCPEGCDDEALDLVETADVVAALEHVEALGARNAALREVLRAVADGAGEWPALRERARSALRAPRPADPPDVEIIAAWGCRRCGRVDAPQPCIGVCIRTPVPHSDAADLRTAAADAAALDAIERSLAAVAGLVAHTVPREEHVEETRAALRQRARDVLARTT